MRQKDIIFQLALRGIRLHLLRSILAAVGIVIGVVAIASVGMMGANMTLAITEQLSDMANILVVQPDTGGGGGGSALMNRNAGSADEEVITPKQLQAIERIAGRYGRVYGLYSTSKQIETGRERGRASIYGLDPEILPEILALQDGGYPKSTTSVIIGPALAERFGLSIGSRIDIGDPDEESVFTVRVSGIIEERGMSFDMNTDSAIVMSDKLFTGIFGGEGEYRQVNIVLMNVEDAGTVKAAVLGELNRKEQAVRVQDSSRMIETVTSSLSTMTIFVMAIAGISLLVAAVSIFNVMMISVTERVREIGIMRSIGTQKGEIRRMFLYESAILGVFGAGIGAMVSIVFGYFFVLGMVGTTDYFFSPASLAYVAWAIGVGVVVCILSGVYPAWRASNLDPIEALRAE